jgi:hypothetical protein
MNTQELTAGLLEVYVILAQITVAAVVFYMV